MAKFVVINGTGNSMNNSWTNKNPTESMIEKSVSTNTRCFTCGSLVYAVEKKMTSNHIYHNRCFRCRICKRNLTGLSLNEEGDDIYCGNCYRKKQRGDCHSIEFQRATAERAQFIYNDHHPDQPAPLSNLRPPVHHDFWRHPSWTLRQLERQYLSNQQEKPQPAQKIKEPADNSIGVQPMKMRASFSTPVNLSQFRNGSRSSISDQHSPSLHFSPVYSPYASSILRTPKESDPLRKSSTSSLSTFDFGRRTSVPNGRRPSVAFDLNRKESKFAFPDLNVTPPLRRSISSGSNRLTSLHRMK